MAKGFEERQVNAAVAVSECGRRPLNARKESQPAHFLYSPWIDFPL